MGFKIGDVVQLKSGGPGMTVTELPNEYLDTITTMWFPKAETEKPSTAVFPPEALALL